MRVEFELAFVISGVFHSREWSGSLKVQGEGLRNKSTVSDVSLNEIEVIWKDAVDYPFEDRVARYLRVDDGTFLIQIYQMAVIERDAEWQSLVSSYGIQFDYSIETDGKMATRSIRAKAPPAGVWKALLSDVEQSGYWTLTVEGPMPWQWENDTPD